MSKIKLITSKFENDFGFMEERNTAEPHIEIPKLANRLMPLTIYTWGIKKPAQIDCQLIFDVSLFTCRISDMKRLKSLTGLDKEIQDAVLKHPRFSELLEQVIDMINTENLSTIAFVCNHGKHRSVAWAEIMKKHCYPNAKLIHTQLN